MNSANLDSIFILFILDFENEKLGGGLHEKPLKKEKKN